MGLTNEEWLHWLFGLIGNKWNNFLQKYIGIRNMFFIFHQRPNHSYWWLDAQEKREEAKALEELAVSKVGKRCVCVSQSLAFMPGRISHTVHCRSPLVHTHVFPLRKRIRREGWSISRSQSRKLMPHHPVQTFLLYIWG